MNTNQSRHGECGVVVLLVVSDLRSRGRGFDSWPGMRRKNSGQVAHTYVPLFTKQYKDLRSRSRGFESCPGTRRKISGQVSHTYVPLFTRRWYVGTGQRAVMPCGWGVKAGMVCVWVAGKTVWSLVTHESYVSALRSCIMIKALYKYEVLYFTLHWSEYDLKLLFR